ncbi:ABC transporter substrate-binding protein [Pseudorhodoplanes sp.]|uniref:ABC transporter substrate-binding protein n=1 Tax=Pseudorhodoplanes sp. TaxID=1934341 RepID=UPI002B717052|nr:ABC transporter substrate-binding protein [Pseudorhodoplanes sp.]HWV41740.1 ABC transporter substrate-binding protein [Pseudorhodoplanes sp.]
MTLLKKATLACAAAVFAAGTTIASAQNQPVKIGFPVFLSGPAVGAFGEPSKNAVNLIVRAMNNGELPAPYNQKGLGGFPIEPKIVDEAGNTATVVTEFKNLVQRDKVDIVVGYVSSAGCLAVAPVAEELEVLTIFYACGASRLFDERDYKYIFRVSSSQTSDAVATARYILSKFPDTTSYSGINQNYSWGQDNWRDFKLAMAALAPKVKMDKELMPKLFAGEFGAEISVLLASGSPIVHSSFFGGDLETFILQASARGLPQKSRLLLTVGEQILARQGKNVPDGTIIGGRGRHGMLASDNPINKWFLDAYVKEFNSVPNFPAYHMLSSMLGLKAAWEKAQAANGGKRPTTDDVIKAFTGLAFETASGPVKMALGKGHQGIEEVAVGTYRYNKATNQPELYDLVTYPAECVNPPANMTSEEWLKKGMPGAKC